MVGELTTRREFWSGYTSPSICQNPLKCTGMNVTVHKSISQPEKKNNSRE